MIGAAGCLRDQYVRVNYRYFDLTTPGVLVLQEARALALGATGEKPQFGSRWLARAALVLAAASAVRERKDRRR